MKKLYSLLLALLMAAALTACGGNGALSESGKAPPKDLDETPVSGFEYEYDADFGGVVISKYTGTSLRVRIPAEIDGSPVTAIVGGAFRDSGVSYIYIPDSVISIGNTTFADCTGLTSITIPEGVASIGEGAFWGCTGLTSITIPKGVTSIGGGAFYGCTGLTSVKIPEGVTSIGSYVFGDCTGLTSVKIPEGLTSVGDGAFEGCNAINTVIYNGRNYGNDIAAVIKLINSR